ncbi:cobalamin-binding protein [Nitrosospira multiformis]|uniref:cobalamin-binding protein n=1 Tax=Nitrosospira multiformis TaxID=1231 RepID=UPI0008987192|nr:cobalamin-binding protein [Nitrosospira multiformis]SEA69781.1 iron complex transport system substrate-binding protein [Nitrosospira multiformis]
MIRHVLILLFALFTSALMDSGNAGGVIRPSSSPGFATPATGTCLSGFPTTVTDDDGRRVRMTHAAMRIISLSPNVTELIFAAGAGKKLVGVSRHSNYPDAAKSIPDIGDSFSLDLERIVALQPDLLLAWRSGNARADIEKLERLGLTVFATEAVTLADVSRLLRIIGTLAGTSGPAERAAKAYEEELQGIQSSYSNRPRVSVFQLIWHQPLMTINNQHLISDVIQVCGGTNVFARESSLTPVVSGENLLEADPDAIISSVSLEQDESAPAEVKAFLRQFSPLSAVRNNNVFFVHPDLIQRQTTRVLRGARLVCEQLECVRSRRKIVRLPDS